MSSLQLVSLPPDQIGHSKLACWSVAYAPDESLITHDRSQNVGYG